MVYKGWNLRTLERSTLIVQEFYFWFLNIFCFSYYYLNLLYTCFYLTRRRIELQVGKAYFELVDYLKAVRAFSLARDLAPYSLEGMDIYSTVLYVSFFTFLPSVNWISIYSNMTEEMAVPCGFLEGNSRGTFFSPCLDFFKVKLSLQQILNG